LVSGISYHGSPDLIREPITHLLAAVTIESDSALPEFKRWCEAHIDLIGSIALSEFSDDDLPTPMSDPLSFEETLSFVRIQLGVMEANRSTTGFDQSVERRYEGLRAMEADLILRIAAQE
jgi:hypothetical protein